MNESSAASVFKIFTQPQWSLFVSEGRFSGSDDDRRDGFIHLSFQEQLEGTLERHFSQQSNLVIAEFLLERLGNNVRMEKSRKGELFPHLFGELLFSEVKNSRVYSG